MEERLSVLKSTFGHIVDEKESNVLMLKTMETRIQQIKKMYNDFIQSNREQLFVFTLDSFHFQGKLVDLEYEDMNRMFLSISNRMYCDYYKLFKIIVSYSYENIPDKKLVEIIKVHDNYPVYKDLEPFKQYDFQYIQSLHEIILVILTYLHTYITNKEHDLKVYQTKNQIGLHIDSFVNTFSFNTIVMNQKALLFVTYMEFFHKSHTKYLKRFRMKLNLMMSQLTNDIKIDASTETKTTNKEMMDKLKEQNVDRALLKELKVSIMDDMSKSESNGTPNTPVQDPVSDLSDEGGATPRLTNVRFVKQEMLEGGVNNSYIDVGGKNITTTTELEKEAQKTIENIILSETVSLTDLHLYDKFMIEHSEQEEQPHSEQQSSEEEEQEEDDTTSEICLLEPPLDTDE